MVQLSEVTYLDNLVYYYLGGVIYTALKKYEEAEEFFEMVSVPYVQDLSDHTDLLPLTTHRPHRYPATRHQRFSLRR